jgi:hypothetical protein
MDPILIFIAVALVAVFGVATRMDLKRRRLRDTPSAKAMGKASRQTKLDSREKGSRWGAGM